jgi:hypothetical protein
MNMVSVAAWLDRAHIARGRFRATSSEARTMAAPPSVKGQQSKSLRGSAT